MTLFFLCVCVTGLIFTNTVVAAFTSVSEETVVSCVFIALPRDGIEFKIWFHFSNTLKTLVICSQLVWGEGGAVFCLPLLNHRCCRI